MSKSQKVVIVIIVVMAVIGAGVIGLSYGRSLNQQTVTHVEQVFADVNGDGTLDLILKGDVIINTGQSNLATSQLSNN